MRTVPNTPQAGRVDAERKVERRYSKNAIYIAAGFGVALICLALFIIIVIAVGAKRTNPKCGFMPKQQKQLVINASAVKPEQFPHYVSLRFSFSLRPHCGGAIISPIWVLTAKHCVFSKNSMKSCGGDLDYNCLEVIAGSLYNVDTTTTIHRVVATKSFTPGVYEDDFRFYLTDVALVEVSPAFAFREHSENKRGITSVCLPEVNEIVNETKADLVGIGYISEFHKISSDRIQTAELDIVDEETCFKDALHNWRTPGDSGKLVCAGVNAESKSGCTGDSGGPLTINRNGEVIQIGILSASPFSGCGVRQTIFTRVAYYRQWIKDTTGV